mmetsp:Transcript_13128/g.34396  ORF Transcript_13128/g.34396 Transcript_13128/m.34396 type:complete len:261 (+) Transcript_13128:138-920(+)
MLTQVTSTFAAPRILVACCASRRPPAVLSRVARLAPAGAVVLADAAQPAKVWAARVELARRARPARAADASPIRALAVAARAIGSTARGRATRVARPGRLALASAAHAFAVLAAAHAELHRAVQASKALVAPTPAGRARAVPGAVPGARVDAAVVPPPALGAHASPIDALAVPQGAVAAARGGPLANRLVPRARVHGAVWWQEAEVALADTLVARRVASAQHDRARFERAIVSTPAALAIALGGVRRTRAMTGADERLDE